MSEKNVGVSDELLSRIATMQKGVYRLDQEISNPCADRRRRGDWYAEPVIKPGLFYLIPGVYNEDNIRVLTMRINRVGDKSHQSIRAELRINLNTSQRWEGYSNPLVPALLPHLTPTWDAQGWLALIADADYTSAHEVIAVLIEHGLLTPALLETAAEEVRRRADAENEKASQ